jgi:hypothetical protein
MRLGIAIKCFFKILFDSDFADRYLISLKDAPAEQNEGRPATPHSSKDVALPRSDAVTLLAALQREARFVDIVNESLDGYSDAQIGAAARDVLRDCGKVLARVFALRPMLEQEEGATVQVPAGYETECYRLTGDVSREPPFAGKLMHAGWQATKCDLPTWTGSGKGALVVAPAEVQLG